MTNCLVFGEVACVTLRALRQRIPAFVQALRRYCTTVRLPINVHVGLLDHVLLQPARARLRVGR
jgi:hypothetical protein